MLAARSKLIAISTRNQLQTFFPEDTMTDEILAKLDAIIKSAEEAKVLVKALVVPPPPPPPPPVVPGTKTFEVTVEKANARCVRSTNSAGRPVMMIYPEDSAPVKDRVQYLKGARVKVLAEVIKADGGERFYQIADPVKKNNVVVSVDLFLKEADGKLLA
jgi:hypothetical protein